MEDVTFWGRIYLFSKKQKYSIGFFVMTLYYKYEV